MYTISVSQTTYHLPKMVRRMWDIENLQDALFYARDYGKKFKYVRVTGPRTNRLFEDGSYATK